MWELFPRDFLNIQNTYLARVGHQLRYVHINHILRKETMNIEDEDDKGFLVSSRVSIEVLGHHDCVPVC